MSVEMNIVIALLSVSAHGPVSQESINMEAKVAGSVASKLLQRLQDDGLVNLKGAEYEADSLQRMGLAVRALSLGADLEHVSQLLEWQEFESIAGFALERNGFDVAKNVRFKNSRRRWELDVVACKKPLILCIDCKHWQRALHLSALKKIVEEQMERTEALAEVLPSPSIKVDCHGWTKARLIPVVLSLVEGKFKFYDNVPIVPILKIQDFVNHLPAYADSLKHFEKKNNRTLDDHFN